MNRPVMIDELGRLFSDQFSPSEATRLVTAPGRVNLIGDHTDYNGLPVFPMAIQQACHIVFAPRTDGLVRLRSADSSFGIREFRLETTIDPFGSGDWGNYLKAAAQALVNHSGVQTGFEGIVHTDVPIAAGLSSSSSLVVAVALAILEVNGIEIPRQELAGVLATGERYVGTEGGGMDQAVSLLAKEGMACLIDFHPLNATTIQIPSSWKFVVASSLVPAAKSGRQQSIYNLRTRQCLEALERINTSLAPDASRSYSELIMRFEQPELLRIGSEVLDAPVMERFRHVVSETDRVRRAVQSMLDGDIVEFGRLMTESHASLRDEYEVSCNELNHLVQIALDFGAVGARLTGAGFGGCFVALTPEDGVEALMDGLQKRFYSPLGVDARKAGHMFIAQPSNGAAIAPI
jgi:galactokinase